MPYKIAYFYNNYGQECGYLKYNLKLILLVI